MNILVSGANGFIGRSLCPYLSFLGYNVVPTVRRPCHIPNERIVNDEFSWKNALTSCDTVVHLAGCSHFIKTEKSQHLAFKTSNIKTTLDLACHAADIGVRRFIFLSTIKVNGQQTLRGCSFRPDNCPAPEDSYANSKWNAEQGLFEIAQNTGMQVVCIRPPLVYGPGVKGNFLSLMHFIDRGLPLPFGSVQNKRSLVSIYNLIDLVRTCIDHPSAVNQTFLVSDDEDLSTTELLQKLSLALNRPARLVPIPVQFLRLTAQLVGKKEVAQRLFGNLQVDISKTKQLLGWSPSVTVDEGLRKTAEWYLNL
ncbi:UDP-glucose 4-epimerase family protein [Zooshikella harenae]|uniref:SDR family oxidoreductase n=1 Tax=Zooshikella harenae TaxID=2827238 RepID=A0ABS5Z8R5_9GAMM|nr:SDR family oxidoreductase [Zooshikella harenae]MBU2710384.1 SDR family oxidoreductase [Zooshikella harenae]